MTRPTRLMSTALTAMVVVALAGSAAAAPASRGADRGTSRTMAPQVSHALGEVPWSSIGPGWLLAKWVPHPRSANPYAFLEVVSPQGARYVLYRIPSFDDLADWSGDGQRALLVRMNHDGTTSLLTLQLRTGAVTQSFSVAGYTTARLSRPAGLAVFASPNPVGHTPQLTRYSLAGARQRAFPEAIGGLGRWNSWWAMSPDGTQLALGYDRGIAELGNDGSLIARLNAPGLKDCTPTRWWTPTVILARCISGTPFGKFRLELFSTGWTGPRAMTRYPQRPDFGDIDAWRVGSRVFVQASSGCGPGWVAELHGVVPVMVKIPPIGPQPSEGNLVLGASSTALAIESTSCVGQASVGWYTPATNSVVQVIGPPLSGGTVGRVLLYPSPTS